LMAFGADVVTHLCLDLLENGVEGLHFYALNKNIKKRGTASFSNQKSKNKQLPIKDKSFRHVIRKS